MFSLAFSDKPSPQVSAEDRRPKQVVAEVHRSAAGGGKARK